MPPTRLGPYRVIRRVGRGGMGTVFMGIDDSTGQTAAVKLLADDMAQQADFRERFQAEIETLRKLNHPNIVRIFGFGEEEDQIFYAMEFVTGSSLEEQLARGRLFPWREVAGFGMAMARALRHAHDRGVIHRDIKPGNLLLAEDGTLKLSDFGIARLFGNARLTGVGNVLGTAEFMAPEQAEGRPVDPRSDLYSLGGVLYVLLARRPLYVARSFAEMLEKQRTEPPAALRQFAADLPAELEQIIHRLLEKDPQRRFATATVLERRLEMMLELFAMAPSDGEPPATVDPPARPTEPAADDASPPIDPLPQTIAATHFGEHPALPAGQTSATSAGAATGAAPPEFGAAPLDIGEETPRSATRFVSVRPGELDEAPRERPAAWVSPQTVGLVIGLLAVGLVGWYLLQPQSADALYRRIERQAKGGSPEALQQAEDDIGQFLARFPDDPRGAAIKGYAEQIEMSRLERRLELQSKGVGIQAPLSPVERCYLDALNAARLDPEAGMARFQAMIDLFDSPQQATGLRGRCIELARQRVSELRRQVDAQSHEQLPLLRERIQRADDLRKTDPQRAFAMYRAVILLYQNKAWAKEAVQQARAALEKENKKEKEK